MISRDSYLCRIWILDNLACSRVREECMNRTRSHPLSDVCVGCARVLQSMEPMIAGMSMKEILQFECSIPNPAGIEWVVGSGADVGADLYMVAPVASAPGPSALYQLDPADIVWGKDGSMEGVR